MRGNTTCDTGELSSAMAGESLGQDGHQRSIRSGRSGRSERVVRAASKRPGIVSV
jgi:hypothetical protein